MMTLEIVRSKIVRFFIYILLLTILIFISLLISISIGSSGVNFRDIMNLLISRSSDENRILSSILDLRLVRSLTALLVGASLALSGLLIQAVSRNPLADPYIFGLSTSSLSFLALGLIIALQLDSGLAYNKYYMISIAFLGAFSGYIMTLILSRFAGGGALSMVLAGVAVSSFFASLSSILLYILQSMTRSPFIYLLTGFFEAVSWRDVGYLAYSLAICFIASMILFKHLNAYLYGDEYSMSVGFNPSTTRAVASLVAALATATTIAIVGVIGFIGIASPHIARALVGSDHKYTIVISILVGGLLVLLADVLSRVIGVVLMIGSIPTGFITALIGSPFLAYIVIRRMRS